MKYMGIDFGSKRVGVAVSDEAGSIAFPLLVIANTTDLVDRIAEICTEHNIEKVVVGESKNFNQQDNDIMAEVHPFVADLHKITGLPVEMHPEFMTSAQAERLQGKNDMLDASAASLILQSYLDTQHNHGK